MKYLITIILLLFTTVSNAEVIGNWKSDSGLPSTITIYTSNGTYYYKEVFDDKGISDLVVTLTKVGNKYLLDGSPTGDYCIINNSILECGDNQGNSSKALPIKTNNPSANTVSKSSTAKEISCYELGVKFGRCGTLSLKGKACSPEDDIVIPERCRGQADTKKGIYDGTKSVY